MKVLLALETALTLPFFLLSWLLCGVYSAVKAGYTMGVVADSAEKKAVLIAMFGGEKIETVTDAAEELDIGKDETAH